MCERKKFMCAPKGISGAGRPPVLLGRAPCPKSRRMACLRPWRSGSKRSTAHWIKCGGEFGCVDYQMRNPNSIIDSLQRKYEKDVAPLFGESQKRKKPRSVPPMQAPSMSRMRTSAGMTLAPWTRPRARARSTRWPAPVRWRRRSSCGASRRSTRAGRPATARLVGRTCPCRRSRRRLYLVRSQVEDGAREEVPPGSRRRGPRLPGLRRGQEPRGLVSGPERRAGLRAGVGSRVGLGRWGSRRGAACVRPRNIEQVRASIARSVAALARLKDAALLYALEGALGRARPRRALRSAVVAAWSREARGKGVVLLGGRRAKNTRARHARVVTADGASTSSAPAGASTTGAGRRRRRPAAPRNGGRSSRRARGPAAGVDALAAVLLGLADLVVHAEAPCTPRLPQSTRKRWTDDAKLPPATTNSSGIHMAMRNPDTHMPTMMPTCAHRFLPVRKSVSPVRVERRHAVDGVASRS